VSPATVGTIQRNLLVLEAQGGPKFFGEPALDIKDLMRNDATAAASSASSPPTS
jgi:DNA helicase HerA-like ATPase